VTLLSTPTHASLEPSPWIARFAHLVPRGARVLDLACGSGRHSRFFADRGARVVAVDRDLQSIASLAGIANVDARALDLETGAWPLAGERFDAVVVANYLHRPLLSLLLDALAGDGAFLYETFARGNEAYGRPSNPAYLLAPDELLDVARGRLTIVAFEQGLIERSDRSAVVQRVAAVGPRRRWPPMLRPA
jgi:SAM-dependent methyltransferase